MPLALSIATAWPNRTGLTRTPRSSKPQCRLEGLIGPRAAGQKHRIDLPGIGEIALDPAQRREDGAHCGLLRLQRELAEPITRQHPGERQADGASDVLLAAEQRLDGDL